MRWAWLLQAGLLLLAHQASAGCSLHDFKWKAGAAPVVTQPSANDPGKVLVSWDKAIQKNDKCADEWTIILYPDGTNKANAVKIVNKDKAARSMVVDVQACVNYRFSVEYLEKETFDDRGMTAEIMFKTKGSPALASNSPTNFRVSYHWDSIKKVVDLRLASITFSRDIIQHASCLQYLEVNGQAVKSKTGPALSRSSSSSSGRGSSFSLASGLSSALPGVARGPLANSYSRSSSSSSARSSSSASSLQQQDVKFANLFPRDPTSGTHKITPTKVSPPFLNSVIEIAVPTKDCGEYMFELKLMAIGSKEVAKVSNLKLPSLADIPEYIPPPLTSVLTVAYPPKGNPTYGVNPSSGMTSSCLPAYLEAYDAYTQRVENDISFYVKQRHKSSSLIADTKEKLEETQEEVLKAYSCACTSPHLEFSTTDAGLKRKYPDQFGHYHFAGIHKEHPYYQQMPHDHAGASHSHTSHGHQGAAKASISKAVATTTARPSSQKTWFLYWEPAKKQWLFGDSVGATSGVKFGSPKGTTFKCPGDATAAGKWSKSGTFSWKVNPALKVACESF